MNGNSRLLVRVLEQLELLDGRFSNIQLVNIQGDVQRGNFSLVFRAHDELEDQPVAIKFYDLDPVKQDPYRLRAFEREHEILRALHGAPRCLQVGSELQIFQLEQKIAGQEESIAIPARYFATEWLERDIDSYFLNQGEHPAIARIRIFVDVLLAVESLHKRQVFHRDLKVDNFRRRGGGDVGEVVAIDLGTAARMDSEPLFQTYGCFVGHRMYAAPEASCGLAGDRKVAPLADIYALGCMLFELFHPDQFYAAFRRNNPDFDVRLSAIHARVTANTQEARLALWDLEAPRLLAGLDHVRLNGPASSAPAAVADLLTDLVNGMTAPNFRSRLNSFARIRERCWIAIRVLENAELSRRRAEQAAQRRAARAAKAVRRARRSLESKPQGTTHG